MPELRRTSFATDDPELAHHHLVGLLGGTELRVERPGEAFGYRHDRLEVGHVVLDDLRNGLATRYTAPPTGRVFVVEVRAGHVATSAGRVHRLHRAGDVFLVGAPDAALSSTYSDDSALSITSVAVPLLHEVDPQHAADRIARPSLPTLDGPTADRWRRATAPLVSALDVVTGVGGPAPGLLVHAWSRLLAATVLEVFAPERDDEHAADRVDALPGPLRRAVAHVEAHPDLDLSPADLAEVAGVGVRALQLAFRKHLDTTPLAHLRRVRLDRVHADLLAADPAHQTVGRIAANWGFADPSRFTALYKEAYGQLPSRTLLT